MTPCDCCGSSDWNPLFVENGIQLGKCPHCDLHSIEHIPDADARMTEMEEGHYAGDLEVLDAESQMTMEKVMASMFQRYVDIAKPLVPGGTWLDIGCGAGLLIGLAQKAGYTGEGLELNAARREAAIKQTGVTVHSEPVELLKLPDDSYDVISLINVFSHLTSPTETLAELRRILKPGGVLVMATGEMTDGVQKSHVFNWNLGDHLYFLGDRTIDVYAKNLGYDVVEHRRAWLPDEMFSKEWLTVKGRSSAKNAIKTAVRITPGGLRLLRAVMLRRQADSKAHSGVFALRPSAG
ncbi:2-polyprenyl-3-methyl-5-hydroxy-6-metoxy-1,4-benzoquinol methylase [Marmoricola sp. OAE513]|uniref:class I SAM-dependent methyltransferase n=1 Tax=Marmoricola sp. OAE513 TaxID=2817894 RepID=UPI001AE716E0